MSVLMSSAPISLYLDRDAHAMAQHVQNATDVSGASSPG